jgi:putative lumazine-binding protein
MQRVLLMMLFAMLLATNSAQSATERDAVLKVVQIFFDTMTARDVDGARQIMMAEGRFYAMDLRKPKSNPQSFTGEEYFARLQKQTQTHRERIWNPGVRVHETIAAVWAPYDFWIDGKFSHCGIDIFDLVKAPEGGWKITGGGFTMEAKCEPSPLGPLKP